MTEMIQWYGELGQDRFVAEILQHKTSGYFVEFGAMNGREYSNTYTLEKHFDWQGIVSEPNPRFHDELSKNRSCIIDNRAFWHTSGLQLDFVCRHHGYSVLGPNIITDGDQLIKVESIRLNDVLNLYHAPDVIDYISMDTEGTELDILSAFDWSRWQVLVWTIEHNYKEPARSATREIMFAHDYRLLREADSQYDDWFVHASVLHSE